MASMSNVIDSFRGTYTAIVTPMKADGSIDEQGLAKLAQRQADAGVTGLVPVGTTGESPTLSHEEHHRVIEIVCEAVGKRIKVIPGTGSNSTAEAVDLTRFAARIQHVSGVMVVSPYYNRPSPEGLLAHFEAVAKCVDLPVIVYDIPGRSAVRVPDETLATLHERCPNVIGIKDATQQLSRVARLRRLIGTDFLQISGEDGTLAAHLAEGGHGVISVMSNVAPQTTAAMVRAWHNRDLAAFISHRDKLAHLAEICFIEPSPAPVKFLLHLHNLTQNVVRLPLVTVSKKAADELRHFHEHHRDLS